MTEERAGKPDETESDGIGVVRAREILGDLVLRAGFGGERIVINRLGKPTAGVVGMRDLQRLKVLDEIEGVVELDEAQLRRLVAKLRAA